MLLVINLQLVDVFEEQLWSRGYSVCLVNPKVIGDARKNIRS